MRQSRLCRLIISLPSTWMAGRRGFSVSTATPGELAPGGARPLLSEDGPPAPAVGEQYEVLRLATSPRMPPGSGSALSANIKDEGMSDDADWSEVTFDDVFDVDAYLQAEEAEEDKSEVLNEDAGLRHEAWGVAAHQGCADAHPSDDPPGRQNAAVYMDFASALAFLQNPPSAG